MKPLVTLESTNDPTFATFADGRIVGWNHGAECLLGHAAADVIGSPCADVICGWDIFGNRYCRENCNLCQMIRRNEPIHSLLLDVCERSGEFIRVEYSVTIVRSREHSRLEITHRLEPAGCSLSRAQPRGVAFEEHLLDGGAVSPGAQLTVREIDVLRLLAAGCPTSEVARLLCISVATVRTHVQNLLGKLQVHSRLEAVSLARRKGLI